jgi:regulatory protein
LRLQRQGLVDDDAFASYWVEQRQTFHPRGARALRAELRQKGVAERCVSQALATAMSDDDAAYRSGLRLARRLRAYDNRDFTTAVSGFLARRGFGWGTIRTAVPRLWEARTS